MTYLLRLSPEHARAVKDACDLYERIAMGQLKEIGSVFEGKNGNWQKQREAGLDQACELLKRILFPDLSQNAYHGIMSPQTGKTAHLCYEVHKQIAHRLAWAEHPPEAEAMKSNDHFAPILFPSGVTPKPECIGEDGNQPELEATGQRIAREIEAELGTTNIKEALKIIRALKRGK